MPSFKGNQGYCLINYLLCCVDNILFMLEKFIYCSFLQTLEYCKGRFYSSKFRPPCKSKETSVVDWTSEISEDDKNIGIYRLLFKN